MAILLLVAIGGLVSVFLVLADMVWGHLSPVFILKEHFYAGTVLPFAVWYGRGESGVVGMRYGGLSLFLLLVCPKGFTLPTSSDYSSPTTTYNITNNSTGSTKIRQSPLTFVYTGFYHYNRGSLANEGSYGYYWSRTASSGTGAYYLGFSSSYVDPRLNGYRGFGLALRCVGG